MNNPFIFMVLDRDYKTSMVLSCIYSEDNAYFNKIVRKLQGIVSRNRILEIIRELIYYRIIIPENKVIKEEKENINVRKLVVIYRISDELKKMPDYNIIEEYLKYIILNEKKPIYNNFSNELNTEKS